MHNWYSDILSRIPEPVVWWDECAVPRYCEFAPKWLANIYATECVLLRISCQSCGRKFDVVNSYDRLDVNGGDKLIEALLRNGGELCYGDPPNVGCCAAGPTMSSDTLAVLQFWTRANARREWTRVCELEKVY